ncbi:cytochrome P450 [Nocardia takedensis]
MCAETYVYDPFAPGFAENPYPHYRELRSVAPAYEHPLGFWIVSRYAEVAELQRSAHSVDEKYLTRLPAWKSDSADIGKRNRMMGGLSLLDQDPPDHTRLRKLVAKTFTPRAVGALRPRMEELVTEALDRIEAAGTADVVAELAFPVPFTVISELLGIPVVEHTRLRALVATLVLALEPLPDPELQARVRAADAELTAMIREQVRHKRDKPAQDLLTALIAAEDDGDVLSEDELVAQVMLLYIAGHETTVNLLANGIHALLRHPDQARRLRAEPELVDNAVEEVLRYDSPVHLMRRVTVAPWSAGGVEIPAGSWVIGCLGSANRDAGFWGEDADLLRVDRPDAGRNVSFGAGVHHCLGSALARLEARVSLPRFVARFPDAEVRAVRWNGRINLRGPAELSITV